MIRPISIIDDKVINMIVWILGVVEIVETIIIANNSFLRYKIGDNVNNINDSFNYKALVVDWKEKEYRLKMYNI